MSVSAYVCVNVGGQGTDPVARQSRFPLLLGDRFTLSGGVLATKLTLIAVISIHCVAERCAACLGTLDEDGGLEIPPQCILADVGARC